MFSSVPLHSSDLVDPTAKLDDKKAHSESDLSCHCLTTKDHISACALTSLNYQPRFAKKLLNIIILEFRQFFDFNPGLYRDVTEDMPEWDTSLEFDTLPELFMQWQNPTEADVNSKMENQLMQIKDVMIEGLEKVIKRGE